MSKKLLRKALLLKVMSWIVLSPVMLAADRPQHSVTLTWFLSSSNSPQWQTIWRADNCVTWYRHAYVSPTSVQFMDSKVRAGETYCYAVTVHDSEFHKTSSLSNIVRVTVPND